MNATATENPGFMLHPTRSYCPIERDIWNQLRTIEAAINHELEEQQKRAFWILDGSGAICTWPIKGRTIRPRPSLDYYDGKR